MEAVQTAYQPMAAHYRQEPHRASLQLTQELIEGFLAYVEAEGKRADTVKCYGRCLRLLYDYLPDDKRVYAGTLAEWRNAMLAEGCNPGTVNMRTSSANSLMSYLGRRELQVTKQLKKEEKPTPELTRIEYLRLLSAAKQREDEKGYFIVKLFGDTGVRVYDLPKVTVESVEAGSLKVSGKKEPVVRFPAPLQKELLGYARRNNIRSGTLIAQSNGTPLARSHLYYLIERVCKDAQVPTEKASPKCLRQMYQRTRKEIEDNVSRLIEREYDWLLENEQAKVGWDA